MNATAKITIDNAVFSSAVIDDVLIVREKQHILHMTKDINAIFSFHDYMDSILSSKAYKALVVFGHPGNDYHQEHGSFLCKALADNRDDKVMDRLLNVFNRLILSLSSLNTITVYAGSGPISLFHLNIGLAFDYRIVTDDTVFESLNARIGMITKGSGYFLPRLLGVRKATEVLQWPSFTSEEALQLGLVDKIVPTAKLEAEAMQLVASTMAGPTANLLGIRKLLKCDIKELQRSLELEDQLIKDRLAAPDFKETFSTYCTKTFGCDMDTLRKSR